MGGRLKLFYPEWLKITKDKFVLQCIKQGCRLNITSVPVQFKKPNQLKFNIEEQKALDNMILQMEKEKVIKKCKIEKGDFINNVFLVQKNTEEIKYRCILNMKTLNKEYIELTHFKMDTLNTCLQLMSKDCFMASIDISNAYHHIPIHPDFYKYLKFEIGNQTYMYQTLPQGFRDSPRLFTKCLKPVLQHLREKGYMSSIYIDDFYIQGNDYPECDANVIYTVKKLKQLGFLISDKSVLKPSQELTHLGFVLNSVTMKVKLSDKKRSKVKELCTLNLKRIDMIIRDIAKLVGTLVACFPAIEYGPLYYRELEKAKIIALKKSQFNYDGKISLNNNCIREIQWWLKEGLDSNKSISKGNPSVILTTDSSLLGWGAFVDDKQTQGLWSEEEKTLHINVLELKAVYLGLMSLCYNLSNVHIQVQMDNTTGIAYINNMGGTKSYKCNEITREMILWCKEKDIWLTACFIAGKLNVKADALSREFNLNLEWALNDEDFQSLCKYLGKPNIDLFASRVNHKLPAYYSYYPDPNAVAINAFAHKWDGFVYIFAPFNLITRVLGKLRQDATPKALVVVPAWTGSHWYPILLKMLIQKPIELKNHSRLLQQPDKITIHPLYPKLKMWGCLVSGQSMKQKDIQNM